MDHRGRNTAVIVTACGAFVALSTDPRVVLVACLLALLAVCWYVTPEL